ncbi:MAG TPA: hypothetical protein VHN99_03370 [Deinococcales bacterium]|nr:hypothetical protein [Deinococcales bacterium]
MNSRRALGLEGLMAALGLGLLALFATDAHPRVLDALAGLAMLALAATGLDPMPAARAASHAALSAAKRLAARATLRRAEPAEADVAFKTLS